MRKDKSERLEVPVDDPVDSELLPFQGSFDQRSPLDQLVREGARRMLQSAIDTEVEAFIASHAERTDEQAAPGIPTTSRHNLPCASLGLLGPLMISPSKRRRRGLRSRPDLGRGSRYQRHHSSEGGNDHDCRQPRAPHQGERVGDAVAWAETSIAPSCSPSGE